MKDLTEAQNAQVAILIKQIEDLTGGRAAVFLFPEDHTGFMAFIDPEISPEEVIGAVHTLTQPEPAEGLQVTTTQAIDRKKLN